MLIEAGKKEGEGRESKDRRARESEREENIKMGEKRREREKKRDWKEEERGKSGQLEKNKEWGRTVSVKIQVDMAFYFIPNISEDSG